MSLEDDKARVLAQLRAAPPPARIEASQKPNPLNPLDRRNKPWGWAAALEIAEGRWDQAAVMLLFGWFRGR